MICKFVFKGDEEIGESIDVYNEHLIVKVEADFIAIPLKNIEKVEDDKILISEFDESEAKKVGEKWVVEKSKPISLEELRGFGFEDFRVETEDKKEIEEASEEESEKTEEKSVEKVKEEKVTEGKDPESKTIEFKEDEDKKEKGESKETIDKL